MHENPDRVEQFTNDISAMRLRPTSGESESKFLVLGVVAAVAGLVLVVLGGIGAQQQANEYHQRAYMATGSYLGLALLVAGATLFLRFSIARFMRFWLIRLVHESRENTDRLIAAIERASNTPPQP